MDQINVLSIGYNCWIHVCDTIGEGVGGERGIVSICWCSLLCVVCVVCTYLRACVHAEGTHCGER